MTYKTYVPKIAFLVLFPTLLFGCRNDDREMELKDAEIDSLASELNRQQQINDSLRNIQHKTGNTDYPIYFGREFDSISNPEEYIINSLKQQEEIIPLEAVLGGTMEFRQVRVLTDDWVLAIYDDGHVQGISIFEYELQEDGEVEFSEVASKLPGQ